MPKKRLIGVVNIIDDLAVQSINFKKYLPIGKPEIYIEYLNNWGIDEIAIVDIKGSLRGKCNIQDKIGMYIKKCFVPVSAGGGIRKFEDVKNLISNGADKVIFNSVAFEDFDLLKKASRKYGNQAIVMSIDIKKVNQKYLIFSKSGTKLISHTFNDVFKIINSGFVGEVYINSIDNDGMMRGYDLNLLKLALQKTNIPTTFIGGVGSPKHILEALKYNVSGLGVGNYFNYFEQSVDYTKKFMSKNKVNKLRKTFTNHKSDIFDQFNRISKKDDSYLEKGYFK
tara:strand:- start:481 stop:1326 length:846 start_codon:yes stop_codon:yes gene_type:complete